MTSKQKVESAIAEIEREAYKRGINEGWSRLAVFSAIVPNKKLTTKRLLEMIQTEAESLFNKLNTH